MASLQAMQRVQAGVCSSSTSTSRAYRTMAFKPCSSRRRAAVVRAAAEEQAAAASARTYPAPPVLSWPQDTETIRDVFSVSGPLAERLNGRLAMLGFAGIALAELSTKQSALEQLGGDVGGVLLLAFTLTFASIFPKLVSGSSLKDLHATATSANLKSEGLLGQALALFDTNTELWVGRIAMVGVLGTAAVEAVLGNTIF